MLYRTTEQIIEAAFLTAKNRIKNLPVKIKEKYKYKENLKSRKNKR